MLIFMMTCFGNLRKMMKGEGERMVKENEERRDKVVTVRKILGPNFCLCVGVPCQSCQYVWILMQ